MKLQIIGDGTPQGTLVMTEDGKVIKDITRVHFIHHADGRPECSIDFYPSKIDVDCEVVDSLATVHIDHVVEVFDVVDVTDGSKTVNWKTKGDKEE